MFMFLSITVEIDKLRLLAAGRRLLGSCLAEARLYPWWEAAVLK